MNHAPRLAPVLLALVACGAPRAVGEGPLPADPTAAFAELERRLAGARTLVCVSRITAEGAVSADLLSEHLLGPDGTARVKASGTFGGQPFDLELVSDGERLLLRSPAGESELPAPSDLRGGLVIGLTRMGWLHNLAVLWSGAPPDAADGSARDFARVVDLAGGESLQVEGRSTRALTFGLVVGGQPSGTGVLLVDEASGLPLERWQRVPFPQGEMRVVEVYERIALDEELAPIPLALSPAR